LQLGFPDLPVKRYVVNIDRRFLKKKFVIFLLVKRSDSMGDEGYFWLCFLFGTGCPGELVKAVLMVLFLLYSFFRSFVVRSGNGILYLISLN